MLLQQLFTELLPFFSFPAFSGQPFLQICLDFFQNISHHHITRNCPPDRLWTPAWFVNLRNYSFLPYPNWNSTSVLLTPKPLYTSYFLHSPTFDDLWCGSGFYKYWESAGSISGGVHFKSARLRCHLVDSPRSLL